MVRALRSQNNLIQPEHADRNLSICSILELVRTAFAASGGEEVPQRKFGKAAEPHE